MHSSAARAVLLTVSLGALAAACVTARSDTSSTITPDECADFNGSLFKKLKGDAKLDTARAREIAAQIAPVLLEGRSHSSLAVTLYPTCKVHRLNRNALKQGRFVGVLTGPGTAPAYSDTPNDVVYMWMFGTDTTIGGADTTVWHARYLSMRGASVKESRGVVCPMSNSDWANRDRVDWHPDTCPPPASGADAVAPRPGGDNPWFGCKLGCCFAVKPLDEG